jgi:hypothetical protein
MSTTEVQTEIRSIHFGFTGISDTISDVSMAISITVSKGMRDRRQNVRDKTGSTHFNPYTLQYCFEFVFHKS